MSTDRFQIPGPWPGQLEVILRPRGGDWLEDEVRAWRRAGIDVVVSLLENDEAAQFELLQEPEAARANGIRFISFPVPDRGVPASLPAALSVIAAVEAALEQGKGVGIHCRQSIGRAGLLAAGILTASGVRPDEAIETVSHARGLTIPETPEQRAWIQRLRSEEPVSAHRL